MQHNPQTFACRGQLETSSISRLTKNGSFSEAPESQHYAHCSCPWYMKHISCNDQEAWNMHPEQVSCLSWISPTKGYPQYREEKCVPESVSVNPRYRKIPQQSSLQELIGLTLSWRKLQTGMNSNVTGSKLPRSILNHWINTTSKLQNQKISTWIKHGHTSIFSHTANTWTSWSARSTWVTWVLTEAWTDFGPVTRTRGICSSRSWSCRCDLSSLPRQPELTASNQSEKSQIHLRIQQSTPLTCHTNLLLRSNRCCWWCRWQRWYHRSLRPVGRTRSRCSLCNDWVSCRRSWSRSLRSHSWCRWRSMNRHCRQPSLTWNCNQTRSISMSFFWNRSHNFRSLSWCGLGHFGSHRCWTSGCSIVPSHLFHCSLWWRCSWLNFSNRTFDLCRLCRFGLLWHTLHWRCLDWRPLRRRLGTHDIRSGRWRSNLSLRWVLAELCRKLRCWRWLHGCRCRRRLRRHTWPAPCIISPQNQDQLRLIQHWWWKFQMLNGYPYNCILNYMAYRCDVR